LMPAYAADNIEEYAVITQAEEDLPSWASSNILQLNMSTDANNYALIPLTENLGLGGSSGDRRVSLNQQPCIAWKPTDNID
jgi:hypothetical protein